MKKLLPVQGSYPERARPVDADIVIHETAADEVIVAEFAYEFAHRDSATRVPCILVMRVRDRVIVESRDYIDPVVAGQSEERDQVVVSDLARRATQPSELSVGQEPNRRDARYP